MVGDSQRRAVAGLVVATWLCGVAPVLLGGRTFASEPHLGETLPWYDRLAGGLRGGRLPEWDATSGLGAPVALDAGKPLTYPPAWLVGALPRPWGTDALLVAHLLLLGLGAAAWARRLGADPLGAVVAGGAAALSTAAIGALEAGGAICAAAWLPWLGLSVDRLAAGRAVGDALRAAAVLAALLLAGGGAIGPAVCAAAVAAAALAARAPARGSAWLALAAAIAAALLLSAVAWLPAALAGELRLAAAGSEPVFRLDDIPALALAAAGALAGWPAARLAGAALALVACGLLAFPLAGVAAAAVIAPLAGLGAARALGAVDRIARLAGRRALIAALLATAALGPLAARAWRLPTAPRAEIDRPPALLAAIPPADGPIRRIAWPEQAERDYADAPPATGARFGFAYLPGRDRARDPQLAALWRASSGAGERLLDLFDVQYAVVPATVAVPAGMPVVGRTGSGERVLGENQVRRPRAFVAPRWTLHADPAALQRELFPVAPDRRGPLSLSHVRLLGAGPAPPPARSGPEPAPPCAIASDHPEQVNLVCRSRAGGFAVLLDRAASGWSAAVDGQPTDIATADLLVRAVPVSPGTHQVSFLYETPGLRLGALLSLAAWLNAAALALLLRRMRQPLDRG
jgi:hypothetical protein